MSTSPIDLVRRTAALANLELSEAEAERLGPQFARILAAFETLAGLDVEGLEDMVRGGTAETALRADEPRPSLAPDAVLGAAPRREGDFYSVPKTVGGDG